MRHIITYTFIILLTIQFSCIEKKESQKRETMINKKDILSIKESAEIISHKEKDFILLDIRTKKEFDAFHIKGAINIDYYSPNFKINVNKLDKQKEYLIYCRTAYRTINGLKIMRTLGLKVSHMEGGITNWIKSGYKVEK